MSEITRRERCVSPWLALVVVAVELVLVRPARAGDCARDADCNTCAGEVCFHHPSVPQGICGVAHAAINCDDSDVCTTDICLPADGTCAHDHVDGCCNTDVDCNHCTGLGCRISAHRCGRTSPALDCSDTDVCTADTCEPTTGTCSHTGIPGCCHPGDAGACSDDDACTVDTCTETNVCAHPVATSLEGVQCLCDQQLDACAGAKVPARVVRRYARACTYVARAAQLSRPRAQRPLLAKASRGFQRAALASVRTHKRRLPAACRLALSELFGTAQGRTDEFRH